MGRSPLAPETLPKPRRFQSPNLPTRFLPSPAPASLHLANQSVVLGVRADPEPHDIRFVTHGQGPVVQANPDGPETIYLLQG